MDKLWAPWRSKYIYLRRSKGCIFCGKKTGSGKADGKSYILARTKYSFSMLNLYPYNNGHVMVAPYRHVDGLEKLTAAEITDMMQLVQRSIKIIGKKLKPHGYNIGINMGRISGAGFAGHVHVHIVPRWTGDTNFMPVISGTKVISESLSSVYKALKTG